MSPPTLYAPAAGRGRAGGTVELNRDEARHVRALRLREGDEVRLTDGRGALWRARLEAAGDGVASCTLLEPVPAPPTLRAELAFGVGGKDRTLWLLEKAVELGAGALQPVEFARSRSVADAARSRGFWRKAERRAVAALKQCGGARLPEVGPVLSLDRYLARRSPPGSQPLRLLAHAAGPRTLAAALAGEDVERGVHLLVGPEGGLTEAEAEACAGAGYRSVRLGPRTLRFETAAIAALAVVAQRDVGP